MPFPIVEAFLLQPEEGRNGKIAICTNTLAPGMVSNEISLDCRSDIAVFGSLVVNRDGAERMIINCLSHPTIEYLILFGQETSSFCPSTNLLCALMNGYSTEKQGNLIQGGRGVAHQYPSVAPHLLEAFKKRFKVLPLFSHIASKEVIQKYLEWLRPNIPEPVYNCIKKILEKKEVYYDSLVELVSVIAKLPSSGVSAIELDPKDFQHLQPPVIELEGSNQITDVPFEVKAEKENILVNIDVQQHYLTIKSPDSFLMAYSIMDFFNKNNLKLTQKEQFLLGCELSRIEMQIRSNVDFPSLICSQISNVQRQEIPLQPGTVLKADKKFYYKIGIKNGKICVQSMAHNTCTSVFELRSKSISPIIDRLVKENRFEDYEQTFLHRVDVGIEAGRAAIALSAGYSYFQDFRNLFRINTTDFPLIVAEGDSFLATHQKIITALYTRGITAQHADAHKGMMRDACVLAIFRKSKDCLSHFPEIYASGSQTAADMRSQYKAQLSSPENDGAYTYGNRTRAYFGFDQLDNAIEILRNNPAQTVIIQRFDYNKDMTLTETPVKDAQGNTIRTRLEGTHDPCLTHDIYFIADNKLHSFHIARAHNIVNAYPENIFGLHDAYDEYIANALGIELGDFFMLSSRGNMLLLTEEQKAKKLIAEPAKPIGELDNSIGPVDLSRLFPAKGIGFYEAQLEERPEISHEALQVLLDYNGADLIEKASQYLKKRGDMHNNPVLGTFDPRKNNNGHLAFFQCNQRGGKLHSTVVFVDGAKTDFARDVELCNYLTTQYKNVLNIPLGNLVMFYVPVRK